MKLFRAAAAIPLLATLAILTIDPAQSVSRGLCADGGSDTVAPATSTPTPTATTTPSPAITPAPTAAPVDCKLYDAALDPGAFDGVCVLDTTDQSWYEHKVLSVETEASSGGKPCTPTTVKKLCKPVDCAYTDAFGACSLVDARWVKTMTRMVQTQPLYGDAACPGPLASTPVSCDADHYCDALTAPANASCRTALAKSTPMVVGYIHSGTAFFTGAGGTLEIWQCVNVCAERPGCVSYTFVANGGTSTSCFTWNVVLTQKSLRAGAVSALMVPQATVVPAP